MFKKRNRSGWTFKTSASASVSVSVPGLPIGGSGGKVTLVFTSPDGAIVEFHYLSVGGGVGPGLPVNLSFSTRDFNSNGVIYVSSTFSGSELSIEDFKGFTLIEEAAYSLGGGMSGTVMLLGIPAKHMPMEIVNNTGALGIGAQIAVDHPKLTQALAGPIGGFLFDKAKHKLSDLLQDDAKAALLMFGENMGTPFQAGISQSIGYVWGGNVTQPAPIPPPGPVKVDVIPKPHGLLLHLPSDVLFAFDKADLKTRANVKPHAEDVLEEAAGYIQAKSPRLIAIEGHTDAIGDPQYNIVLSTRRAQAVAQWLISRKIVKPANLKIKGWGEWMPAVPNQKPNGSDDPVGRAKNRRVEIWLFK